MSRPNITFCGMRDRSTMRAASGSNQKLNSAEDDAFPGTWTFPPMKTSRLLCGVADVAAEHHLLRNARPEHDAGGFGVEPEVELRRGRRISRHVDVPSHEDEPLALRCCRCRGRTSPSAECATGARCGRLRGRTRS